MKLKHFVSERGRVSWLATQINVPASLISDWANGKRPVPAERCPDIERATQGAVSCESMRPDVDWAVLRKRKDAPKEVVNG